MAKKLKVKTLLECLVEIHNVQIMQMTIVKVDREFFESLAISDPDTKEHFSNKAEADTTYKRKQILVRIVNRQIAEEIKILARDKKKKNV